MNQKMMIEPPDGIIITISQELLKERGTKNWLKEFLDCMANYENGHTYWMRQGNRPKHDILYVYLCLGNKVRYRAKFVSSYGEQTLTFNNGKTIHGKAWIVMTGPIVKGKFPMKGFQGFRYTKELF